MDERRREADEREETVSDLLDFGMSGFGSACSGMFCPFLTSNKTHTSSVILNQHPLVVKTPGQKMLESFQHKYQLCFHPSQISGEADDGLS